MSAPKGKKWKTNQHPGQGKTRIRSGALKKGTHGTEKKAKEKNAEEKDKKKNILFEIH